MIITIPIMQKHACLPLVDEMYRLRSRVFKDILNWDVFVDEFGQETDQFDDVIGTYFLAVDDDLRVQASLRLLPTTGPYMAADVFQDLLEDNQAPKSVEVWESSRFFARPLEETKAGRARRYWATQAHNQYIAKLLCGLGVYADEAGISTIISVFDVAVERFLRSMGVPCDRLGDPQVVGNTRAVAGAFGIDLAAAQRVAEMWDFSLDGLVLNAGDHRVAGMLAQRISEREESRKAA